MRTLINIENRNKVKVGDTLFFNPPKTIRGIPGKTFSEATCTFVLPNKKVPEIVVDGIPNEDEGKESFVLILNGCGDNFEMESPSTS